MGRSDAESDGFRLLFEVRQAAALSERTAADASKTSFIRRPEDRPQWALRRPVPHCKPFSRTDNLSHKHDAPILDRIVQRQVTCHAHTGSNSEAVICGDTSQETRERCGGGCGEASSSRRLPHASSRPGSRSSRQRCTTRSAEEATSGNPQASRRPSVTVVELRALQQELYAQDEALVKQLTDHSGVRSYCENELPFGRCCPIVPKVSTDPPILRAWRRRQKEGVEDVRVANGQDEAKKQVERMKVTLTELCSEVQELQNLMEEDAIELVENLQAMKEEMRIRRSKNAAGADFALILPPSSDSWVDSACAMSSPSSTSTSRSPLGSREVCVAMSGAAATAATQQTTAETQLSIQKGDDQEALRMQPLPRYVLTGISTRSSFGGVVGMVLALTSSPPTCHAVVDRLAGKHSLDLGCVCRALAAALHTSEGRRIWPHIGISVAHFPACNIDRGLRNAIAWNSVRSISLYGASDAVVPGLLAGVLEASSQDGARTSLELLCLRCSAKGSEAAIQKRNRFGDSMGIGDLGAAGVVAKLSLPPFLGSLRTLDCAWNHLGDAAMTTLQGAWPEGLCSLCLDWNSIGVDGAVQLAKALVRPVANALRTLNLRSNPLQDDGVIAICEGARSCVGLSRLGLGETMLTDRGACEASHSLRTHPSLAELDVGENLLTDGACEALSEFVRGTPSLRTLTLRGFLFERKRITDAGGLLLARSLASRGSSDFELDLDYQQVGCRVAMEMAAQCHAWSRLSMLNTELSTTGAMKMANVFRQRQSLARGVRLNVAQCRIGAGAIEMLRSVGFRRLDSHGQRAALS